MVTAPCPIELPSDDDSRFVLQALATYLAEVDLPPDTQFHELPSASHQSEVIRRAHKLKFPPVEAPTSAPTPRTGPHETPDPVRGIPFSRRSE